LAVFVHECLKLDQSSSPRPELISPAEVDDAEQAELDAEFAHVDELAGKGELDFVELSHVDLPELITQRIKQALSSKGWTQAQLASEIGVSPTVISRVLSRPDRSRVDTLQRISKALGVDLGSLLAR
jgi:ribosome-binding protein aMBF1 (putative translation factor)